jgi:hypothetical protein
LTVFLSYHKSDFSPGQLAQLKDRVIADHFSQFSQFAAQIGFAPNAVKPVAAPRPARGASVADPPSGKALLLTPREAAARLRCSGKTLFGHVASGALRYVAVGQGRKRPRKMFTDSDLNEFISNQTRKDLPAPWPSSRTRVRPTGASTSRSEVIAFSARQQAGTSGKRKR